MNHQVSHNLEVSSLGQFTVPDRAYQIRTASREEVDLAVQWAADEGWNPGIHDADCFFAADQNGFLIGLLDDQPIATISAVRYEQSFGFIGFYIVKPQYRTTH